MSASLSHQHIAFRSPDTAGGKLWGTQAEMIAYALVLASSWVFYLDEKQQVAEGLALSSFTLHYIRIVGFSLLLLTVFRQCIVLKGQIKAHQKLGNIEESRSTRSPKLVPLYVYMVCLATLAYAAQGFFAAIAIYLDQMLEMSDLFLKLALYIWIGMLLKQTQLIHHFFKLFRPFNLSPEVLCFVLILCAALPTALTGASGIFILAAGGVIYRELIQIGTRPQLALATTAMSGSLGVVLRPCLLILIIAALNKSVTTDELFHTGKYVFFFTCLLFLAFTWLVKVKPFKAEMNFQNFKTASQNTPVLFPYLIIALLVYAFYAWALNAPMNEFNLPAILPIIVLAYIAYEKRALKKQSTPDKHEPAFSMSLFNASSETAHHMGAILALMAFSLTLGGIAQHMNIFTALPLSSDNLLLTALTLVIALVIIGMFLDPYGAVVLVNATIATLAYQAGIAPLHFWMICLVAFELGYLSPPVALNHLLTRHVIGEHNYPEMKFDELSFYRKHERIILPIMILATALIGVAFLPLVIELSWFDRLFGYAN
jgi:TRAP-type C4-dicarboxylate transport system permease large subunit